MEFAEELKIFSERVLRIKDKMQTEEAIKTSIVMPFFQLLGYDIFNPEEFIPEYTTDVGIKKGEKIDYVIMDQLNPVMLIEVKNCPDKNLKKNVSQLFRYFAVSKARYGMLTNGFHYIFYTDLEEKNIMDRESFFEFNIFDMNEKSITELKRYIKSNFNVEEIYESASELRYVNKINQLLTAQLRKPSDEFVKYILGEIYIGVRTKPIVDRFREYAKTSLNHLISEDKHSKGTKTKINIDDNEDNILSIIELEAFYLVKSIIRKIINCDKISFKNEEDHLSVFIENNNDKWVCKLKLKDNSKVIMFPHENEEIGYDFEMLDDLYELEGVIVDITNRLKAV